MRLPDFYERVLEALAVRVPGRRQERQHRLRTTNMMCGFVLSLGALVLLANVPLDFLDGRRGPFHALGKFRAHPADAIAMVTVHDVVVQSRHERPRELHELSEILPEAEMTFTPLDEGTADETPAMRPAPVMKPVAIDHSREWSKVDEALRLREIVGAQTPPRLETSSIVIRYPMSAISRGVEGQVVAEFTVETDGRASDIEIVQGIDPICDREVVRAIQRAEFMPSRDYGRAVVSSTQLIVRFVLTN